MRYFLILLALGASVSHAEEIPSPPDFGALESVPPPICEHELAAIEEASVDSARCRSAEGAAVSWKFKEPVAVKKGDVIRLFGPGQQKVEVWRKVEERQLGE